MTISTYMTQSELRYETLTPADWKQLMTGSFSEKAKSDLQDWKGRFPMHILVFSENGRMYIVPELRSKEEHSWATRQIVQRYAAVAVMVISDAYFTFPVSEESPKMYEAMQSGLTAKEAAQLGYAKRYDALQMNLETKNGHIANYVQPYERDEHGETFVFLSTLNHWRSNTDYPTFQMQGLFTNWWQEMPGHSVDFMGS